MQQGALTCYVQGSTANCQTNTNAALPWYPLFGTCAPNKDKKRVNGTSFDVLNFWKFNLIIILQSVFSTEIEDENAN